MASNYPGSLDSFDTIASDKKASDSVGGRTHRQMHNDLGDAIEAVQGELGTDPAGAYATVKARFEAIEGKTSGTGTPEGVVTAPPLSRYLQTSGAATASGAQEWVKDYGTGPTGWVAGAEADTGHRNIYASVANGQTNDCRLRRWGNLVELVVGVSGYTDAAVAYTLPNGFRPSAAWMNFVAGTATVQTQVVARSGTGEVLFYGAGGSFTGVITFLTSDLWPSSLPGSAA